MTRTELLKTAKPILFNTEMVQAILDGRKTVTRRVLKNQDENAFTCDYNHYDNENDDVDLICDRNGEIYALANKPPCYIGDILYVREAFAPVTDYIDGEPKKVYAYKASTPDNQYVGNVMSLPITAWHPSIHMPKEAARIFLRVTNVRVERLQEIITDDYRTHVNIYREGLYKPCTNCVHPNGECEDFIDNYSCRLIDTFTDLWNSTVKKSDLERYGWAANPWVWVIEFEKLDLQE